MGILEDSLADLTKKYLAAKAQLEDMIAAQAAIPDENREIATKLYALLHNNKNIAERKEWTDGAGSWDTPARTKYLSLAAWLLDRVSPQRIVALLDKFLEIKAQ